MPVFRQGKRVLEPESTEDARKRAQQQLAEFHAGVKRFVDPHAYSVGLEAGLHARKMQLIRSQRGPQP